MERKSLFCGAVVVVAFCVIGAGSAPSKKTGSSSTGAPANSHGPGVDSPSPSALKRACISPIVGVETRGWKIGVSAGEYQCSTPYKKLVEGDPAPNNIAYYVSGGKDSAKEAHVTLNVNTASATSSAYDELADACNRMVQNLSSNALPDEAVLAVRDGKPGTWSINGLEFELKREKFASGSPTKGGHSMKCSLRL